MGQSETSLPDEARVFIDQVQAEYLKLRDPAFLREVVDKDLLTPLNEVTDMPTSHGAKITALAMGIVGVVAHAVDLDPNTTPRNRTQAIAAGLNAITRVMIDLHQRGVVGVLDDQPETAHGRA